MQQLLFCGTISLPLQEWYLTLSILYLIGFGKCLQLLDPEQLEVLKLDFSTQKNFRCIAGENKCYQHSGFNKIFWIYEQLWIFKNAVLFSVIFPRHFVFFFFFYLLPSETTSAFSKCQCLEAGNQTRFLSPTPSHPVAVY